MCKVISVANQKGGVGKTVTEYSGLDVHAVRGFGNRLASV